MQEFQFFVNIVVSIFCVIALPAAGIVIRKLAVIETSIKTIIESTSWHTTEINKLKDKVHDIDLEMARCPHNQRQLNHVTAAVE